MPTVPNLLDPCEHDLGDGYSVWECWQGEWFAFHDGRMIGATVSRGCDNRAEAVELAAYHKRETMKQPKTISNCKKISQPSKGAGVVTMASSMSAGGKTKK